MLDKTYDSKCVEPEIARGGTLRKRFAPARMPSRMGSFTIVIPPPNVTGSLHMGHETQLYCCRTSWFVSQRMRGKDVLWQTGMDHGGIATQMVVERKLAAEQRT